MEPMCICFLSMSATGPAPCMPPQSLPEEMEGGRHIGEQMPDLVIGVDKEHEGNLDEWDIVIDTNVKSLVCHDPPRGSRYGGAIPWSRYQYRVHCRRLRLSGRQCVLCLQGCRHGPSDGLPHRPGGYPGTRNEYRRGWWKPISPSSVSVVTGRRSIMYIKVYAR